MNTTTFELKYSPYFSKLKSYCKKISINEWDAEDLYQESILKLFLFTKQHPERPVTNKLLYKIAFNQSIDQKRKQKLSTENLEHYQHNSSNFDSENIFQVKETLEMISLVLTPLQFVVILLMDAYKFNAKETAHFLKQTEANIYTTAHRARKKLLKYRPLLIDHDRFNKGTAAPQALDPHLLDQLILGFTTHNISLIQTTYLQLANNEVKINIHSHSMNVLSFHFIDLNGNQITITSKKS